MAKKSKTPKPAKAKPAKTAALIAKTKRGETKQALCHDLLTRKQGCTGRDLLDATGWPAISVPATAAALGLKLRKQKDKGKPMTYFGTPA